MYALNILKTNKKNCMTMILPLLFLEK